MSRKRYKTSRLIEKWFVRITQTTRQLKFLKRNEHFVAKRTSIELASFAVAFL